MSVKVLVTGATGFIGFHVAKILKQKNLRVVALARKGNDLSALQSLGVESVTGDVRDYDSVCRAAKGCRQIYHLAADYRLWVPDPAPMYATNVGGTRNIMQATLELGIERVIYTSTVGTLAASANGKPSDENTPSELKEMVGDYKRSKFIAEQEVYQFVKRGAPVVIVSPSTPIGPMDRKPTPTGKIIVDFLNGRMPAYLDTGLNFVDVEDVAMGYWLASRNGKVGQRYILGGKNITLRDFFELIAGMTGRKPPRVRLPYLPVLMAAYADEALSKWITGKPPRIPLTGVKMARKYMFFDCSKAVRELHLPQNPIEGAVERAIAWFRDNGYIAKR
jgi:dihydroflavonol-4-reductase